ncbi:MAG: PIG-L family deacetylase [Acidobacteriota bacterium]|jgi:LmbE family N-acetylglucosaminyl deacetylase
MTRFSPPPGTVSRIRARRALVIAPHFDDEVLGCGGLLRQLIRGGCVVRVLFLSDAAGGVEEVGDRQGYAARRRKEAATVADRLGIESFHELDLPDGDLLAHLMEIAVGIGEQLAAFRPDLLLVPSPTEITGDHRAAFLALHRTLAPVRQGQPLYDLVAPMRILTYEVNRLLHPDVLVDVGAEVNEVAALVALYASQAELHDYAAAALGLRRYRTLGLSPAVRAAEAYRTLSLDEFVTHSAMQLVEHLGGIVDKPPVQEGPLVSVIVRTRDRPRKLAEALASIAGGTYRAVEVVVVNDGGEPPELPPSFPFPIVCHTSTESGGPAAAAQAGLAVATGDYVCFLDDDDLFFPEHLARLVDLARETACPVVYSDAAVGVYERTDGGEWQCVARRLPYSRDYDGARLVLDNYIPFNTVLMKRDLAAEIGPFDESLPFFEDWDYLIRLSTRTRFEHLPAATCEYRHFRGDASHVFGSDPQARADFRAGRARIYAKHSDRLGPNELAEAVNALRAEASTHAEQLRTLLAQVHRLPHESGDG